MLAPLFTIALLLSMAFPVWSKPLRSVHPGPARSEIAQRQILAFENARWQYYAVGLGTCGTTNADSDFVVALNIDQYGSGNPSPNCFKQITMNYNGKTTVGTIVDECRGCPYEGLDLSPALFEFFAPLLDGVIYGTWWYND